MKESPAEIRWKGHKRFVAKNVRFQPEYADLVNRLSADLGITQREVLERALRFTYQEGVLYD